MRRLLIRPGAIGDFLVSLPALESLRADYTEVWCAAPNVPLAGFADRALSIGAAGLDRLGLLPDSDVWTRLRGFDSIVSWYGANRPEFRERVRELPITFHSALPGGACHATDFYLAQVGAPPGAVPRLPVERRDGGYVAIHPFASSPAKRAPLATFRARAAELPEPVIWLRGPEERLDGATCIPGLGELAQFLAGARLYLGNDSGITHLAAAVGTPVEVWFGPTDPAIWAPRGPHVRIHRIP